MAWWIRCIEKVQGGHGWARRRAMLALGAMRVPEAIAPLSEVLDDWQLDTRMTAVQSLGRTCLPEAAEPIIESYMVGGLKVPPDPIANALVRCFVDSPGGIDAVSPPVAGGLARIACPRCQLRSLRTLWPTKCCFLRLIRGPKCGRPRRRRFPLLRCSLRFPLSPIWRGTKSGLCVFAPPLRSTQSRILARSRFCSKPCATPTAWSAYARLQLSPSSSSETVEILQSIVDSRDRYALHAMISALELGGGFEKVMAELADPDLHDQTARQLLAPSAKAQPASGARAPPIPWWNPSFRNRRDTKWVAQISV